MHKLSLIAVIVISAMPNGYRRANIAFNKGENAVDVTDEQYKQIAADHNLLIEKTKPVDGTNSQGLLDNQSLGDGLANNATDNTNDNDVSADSHGSDPTGQNESLENGGLGNDVLDVSTAPEHLQVWLIAIDELNAQAPLTKKPNCDELEVEIDIEGTEGLTKTKPTGAQRDDAWAWYQANVLVAQADKA